MAVIKLMLNIDWIISLPFFSYNPLLDCSISDQEYNLVRLENLKLFFCLKYIYNCLE